MVSRRPQIKKLISSNSANRNVDTFRSYSLPPSSVLLSRQAVTTSNPLENLKDFHSQERNTTDQLAVESGQPQPVRVLSSLPPPTSRATTTLTTQATTTPTTTPPATSSSPPHTSLTTPGVVQPTSRLPVSKIPTLSQARVSSRPHVTSDQDGGQVSSLPPPTHLTSSPPISAGGDEAMTGGSETEQLHHSKEWQEESSGGHQGQIQEQAAHSRSSQLGLTAPGGAGLPCSQALGCKSAGRSGPGD